ncbi:conserved protein of unknown function [Magnetospirillum sp. XM-1]|uniref:methyltransferase domain-containing protein n=1 Tax=Magnetospirillum sp. XM-1 TaxID=1663591 RepID=UPI00073E078F|nr:methyltransferase domain-containing protein [Magnetospirillum sp. XM-1]CUW38082.1 conserved protein of unknown function [Magnetospirillum sp. XM-1]
MREWLIEHLICPTCPGEVGLSLSVTAREGDDILEGELACPACDARFPVRGGVPRFTPAGADYCGNFGFQWNKWRALQIDRLSGHQLSAGRFFGDSGWDPAWLEGKLILDAGCGAGRFSDVAASAGARVIACDLSSAVNACRETTAAWDGRVQPIQASIFDLPLRRGIFDGVFCMGVIQHTPDPKRLMSGLPAFLKPGGRLAYNFYEADFWPWLQGIKYALRLVTPHLPTGATLALSRALVRVFFPLTAAFARLPVFRTLNVMIPICPVHDSVLTPEQRYAWTVLDTFDWYSPRYEKRQKHKEVIRLLTDAGMTEVTGRAGAVIARAPTRG